MLTNSLNFTGRLVRYCRTTITMTRQPGHFQSLIVALLELSLQQKWVWWRRTILVGRRSWVSFQDYYLDSLVFYERQMASFCKPSRVVRAWRWCMTWNYFLAESPIVPPFASCWCRASDPQCSYVGPKRNRGKRFDSRHRRVGFGSCWCATFDSRYLHMASGRSRYHTSDSRHLHGGKGQCPFWSYCFRGKLAGLVWVIYGLQYIFG